jgi:hypothetical protein
MSSETKEKEKEIRSESGQSEVIDRQQISYRLEVDWSADDNGLDPDHDRITLSTPLRPCSNPVQVARRLRTGLQRAPRPGPRIRRITHVGVFGDGERSDRGRQSAQPTDHIGNPG